MLEGLNLAENESERSYVEDQVFTLQDVEDVATYNKNIKDFDPMYNNLESINYNILVRAYKTSPVEEDGVFIPPTRNIEVSTAGGKGVWTTVADPWLFSQKVVAVSGLKTDRKDIVPGEELIISQAMIGITPTGDADNVTLNLKNSFIHPESGLSGMPTDPANKHHGYFLIPVSQLLFSCGVK